MPTNENLKLRKKWKDDFDKLGNELHDLAMEADISSKLVNYKMDKDKLKSISRLLSLASNYYEDLSDRVIKKEDFLKK